MPISFINTDTDTVTNVIQTGGATFPSGLAISPDGSYALVTSYIDDNPALLVVDIASQTITSRFPLDRRYPQSVFLSPDATVAWVTYPFDAAVEVIDVMTGTVNHAIAAEEPIEVVFNPTGTRAYISDATAGAVLVVDTASYKVINSIPTGQGASGLQLSLEGGLLSVDNYYDNSISLIDTGSLSVLTTVPVGDSPHGIAQAPIK
jgi:YVTN family beta-propeller protein